MHKLKLVFLVLFLSFILMSCGSKELTITSVEIDSQSISSSIDIKNFDISNLNLIVTYSDGSTKAITVTNDMLSAADLEKLNHMGTHQIMITYLDNKVSATLVMIDSQTLDSLMSYYNFAVDVLGLEESYETWVSQFTAGSSATIISAAFNSQNQLIITLSNQQTINLGEMSQVTFVVTFYNYYGEMIKTQTVPRGGSASAPSLGFIQDYVFASWDGNYQNVQSNLELHAIYDYVGTTVTGIENSDELIISLTRLEEAQFEVDLDSVFTNNNDVPLKSSIQTLSSVMYQKTLGDSTNELDPTDYNPHTYWKEFFFHKNLYQKPAVIDGYQVLTSTLNSFSDHALNNLYLVNIQVTAQAKGSADWAVENLTVVDTWVKEYDKKYLLHYDEQKDRVELYTIWEYEPSSLVSYEKIFVYYNEQGEEVIESWINQYYTTPQMPGFYGALGYYNSVAGRDFNYYTIYLNEFFEPSNNHVFRGVNLNEQGIFEYYENYTKMISGEYGWYDIMTGLDYTNEEIYYIDTLQTVVYSPDASSNVFGLYSTEPGTYRVNLYLPALNGIEALLVEDGGMIKENQDSPQTQQMLIEQNSSIMPDWYNIDLTKTGLSKGFKTSKGSFYTQKDQPIGDVTLIDLEIGIATEGTRKYDNYYNYLGIANLSVKADSIKELVERITVYLDEVGLSYKYGSTELLFKELEYIYENYERIGSKVSIINDVMGGPKNTYEDFKTLMDTEAFIKSYLDIRAEIVAMEKAYSEISIYQMPSKNDLNKITLIDTASNVSGSLKMENSKIVTNDLKATLNKSPLLQTNASYSLYYALQVGGKLIEIAHEAPQIFIGQNLTFNGNLTINIPTDLETGDYQFVIFFAKVINDDYLRVSNAIHWTMTDIVESKTLRRDDVLEFAYETSIFTINSRLEIKVEFVDIYGPKVEFIGGKVVYKHGETVTQLIVPFNTSVKDMLEIIRFIDNVDGIIPTDITHITKNQNPVNLDDLMTETGWAVNVTDKAGNKTEVAITTIKFGYEVTFMFVFDVYSYKLVESGQLITLPVDPDPAGSQLDGYVFGGWFLDVDGTQPFNINDPIIKDMILYSKWMLPTN